MWLRMGKVLGIFLLATLAPLRASKGLTPRRCGLEAIGPSFVRSTSNPSTCRWCNWLTATHGHGDYFFGASAAPERFPRDRLASCSYEDQRQEELLQTKAFLGPEVLKLNAHAIRPDDSDNARA